ncbi:hypothetical protein M9435_004736 [Picochlorum sp. BPE23]|nr:hypothetical protein M9435_004736 [Picochlorum sp. BPE23]
MSLKVLFAPVGNGHSRPPRPSPVLWDTRAKRCERTRLHAQSENGSYTPLSSPLCRECGGRRMIKSSAGYLPCPVCVPWSQRPDYTPRKLIDSKDLNLTDMEVDDSNEKQRKPTVMTEERRLAIKQAMQNRGPLAQEHRRKISNSVRARYASDPSLRQVGKRKRCSVCGQEGHNKKTCPQLSGSPSASTEKRVTAKSKRRPPTCSVCGEIGHRKTTCPQLTNKVKQDVTLKPDIPEPVEVIFENESVLDPLSDQPRSNAFPYPTTPVSDAKSVVRTDRFSKWPMRSLRGGSEVAVSKDGTIIFPLPVQQDQCVAQAAAAVQRAWEDGIRRQNLEILLPQQNSAIDGGWPGGIKQQFRVALPIVESLLLILKDVDGLQGRITAEFLDETDCVGAWQSEKLAAVLFPTAETIPSLQRIDNALSGERLNLIINPQWQLNGQVVSDFGFGKQRALSEKFINSLEYVYYLQRIRIMGDEVRVLRCYPGKWQVYWMGSSAKDSKLLAVEQHKPSYERLVEILKSDKDTRVNKSWIDRFLDRRTFDEIATWDSESAVQNGAIDIVTGEVLSRGEENNSNNL